MATALVTGATSGIGREFCWQISNAGHNLVVVARDRERLVALAHNISRVNGVAVEVMAADLSDPEDLARVCQRLSVTGLEDEGQGESRSSKSPIGLLVNAAGFGMGKPFLENSFNGELAGLDVMVRAVMATCYYAGRTMKKRGQGTIINISSVAADTGMGPYSAHKAWVRAFSEGLAEELRGTGVGVTAVMPGLVKTEFHARSGADLSAAPQIVWTSTKQVVEQSLMAARRGQVLLTPTLRYKAVSVLQRLMPRTLLRAVVRQIPHT